MKKIFYSLLGILTSLLFVQSSLAADPMGPGGQVFYRLGAAHLKNNRGGEVFTDALGTGGKNDSTSGWDISAGLDTALIRQMGPGSIIGEIMVDYAKYSHNSVNQATSVILNGIKVGSVSQSTVTVSELTVVVAPKYRFEGILDGKVRPWIIPVGLAFLVNSPPSNNTAYLDIGYHLGAGVEYMLIDQLSIGVDYRYTIASGDPGIKATNGSAALYLGINF